MPTEDQLAQPTRLRRAPSSPKPIASRDRSPRLSLEMRRSRLSEGSPGGTHGSFSKLSAHHCPPALSSGRSLMSDVSMQRTFHESMRQRRTSLPANSLTIQPKLPVATSNVSEARGLVVDMLNSRELPGNVVSCLKAVATLLNPQQQFSGHIDFGLPSVVENPYSGESLVVNSSSKPRVSNITFSTVTSATGLPTIAAEPSRSRSSSYWKPEPSTASETHPPHAEAPGCSTAEASTTVEEKKKENDVQENHVKAHSPPAVASPTALKTQDGFIFDTRELDRDPHYDNVSDWSLPIFTLSERYKNTVLTRLTYTIFKQADLFRIFKVPVVKFFNFFHALERGYWDIPYHNRIHAADVLHGVYYLTCHPIRPSFGRPSTPESPIPRQVGDSQPVTDSMSTLEIMALYTAAAMHDYDHPGRTNAFLVAAEDRKAILYNDRSVLENHHAAESWRLLCAKNNQFIESLDAAETKRFRYLVLEYILATDLKQHFEIIMTFNEKTADMEMSNESDRLLVAKMMIKMADINSPTKPYDLHRQWTERICEEFYEQGDEEKRRGMPVTPYMDRGDPAVAKLQDSFIAHVVSPLAVALNEVGLLPILPGLEESELMINLRHNHQKWLVELDSESASSGVGTGNETIEEESSTSESPDASRPVFKRTPSVESEFDMCTIREHDEEEYV